MYAIRSYYVVGTNPEKLENIPFAYAQDSLNAEQKNTLRKIAEITKKKPNLRFTLRQQTHPEVEKQYLALEIIKDQSSSSHLKKEIIRDSSQYADNNRDAFVVSLGKVDDNSVQNASAVITSYSIHYTKLYESAVWISMLDESTCISLNIKSSMS